MLKSKLVLGVGVNDLAEPVKMAGQHIPVYTVWRHMLQRCYDPQWHARFPMYIGCTVDPRWHRLSVFKMWFDAGWRPGYHLDKDILVPGNKVYGPNTCVFVPARINTMLTDRKASRGDLPLGVARNRKGFRGHCNNGVCQVYSQPVRSIDEAVAWYNATKSRVIRRAATEALVRREIDLRTHAALLRHARHRECTS